MRTLTLGFLLLAVVVALSEANSRVKRKEEKCTRLRHFRGCRASLGHCQCMRTRACKNPFAYRSRNECMADIRGLNDKCLREPCEHGECTQVKMGNYRSWYCECAGSGYHGYRCELECPKHTDPAPADYPPACAMVDDEDVEVEDS